MTALGIPSDRASLSKEISMFHLRHELVRLQELLVLTCFKGMKRHRATLSSCEKWQCTIADNGATQVYAG